MSQNAWSRLSIRLTLALALFVLFNIALVVWEHPHLARAADQPQLLVTKGNNLVVLNTEGVVQRTLYNALGQATLARWSPDGNRVAFSTDGKFGVINADGSDYKKLAEDNSDSYTRIDFDWSADGSQIIFSKGYDANSKTVAFFRINSDGSNSQKLFDLNADYSGRLIGYWPGEKKLLYQEDLGYGPGAASRVVLSNLDGSDKVKLLDVTNFYVSVEFSPDRTQVLFKGFLSTGAIASVADPVGTIQAGFGNSASWSNVPGKVITLSKTNSNSETFTGLVEEVDLATKTRRTIATTPPLKPFGGEGSSVIGLTVTPAGFAAFTNFHADSYIVNLANGQVRDIGTVEVLNWCPSGASNGGGATTYGKILPDFYNVWKQSDLPIAQGQSKRSWLWGPDAFATKTEDYKEAKGGQRQVQYFDKARMEINNPDGDRSNLYFVTNGLLPKELITGQMQVGDSSFITKSPADINVAGDPGGSVTYAKLASVTTLAPGQNVATDRTGQSVTASIDRTGAVSQRQALAGVQLAQYVKETQHNLPNVFVDYFKTLPQDWVFVMGYPLSEPYLTDITLNGKPTQALVQVFERRVLTYTPSNADPYKVEQGNVGQHYYKWRYGG